MFTTNIGIGRKITLAVMVVTLCAVANSAGPASAILMLPSFQTVDAASFDFFLNGTRDDLWPSTLQSRHIGGAICFDSTTATNALCIGGGYQSIKNHFAAFARQPQSSAFSFDTEDSLGRRTLLGNMRNAWSRGSETWTQSSHVATTMLAEPIRATWSLYLRSLRNPLGAGYDNSINRFATVEAEIPVVRVACAPTQTLSN